MNAPVEWSLFLGFGLYLALMLVIGLVTVRYMRSLDDFVLGGRRLGPWVAAVSERASGESVWFLLGLPGAAYAFGFQEFWSVIGIAFGIFGSWTLIAVGLRGSTGRAGALTIPDHLASLFPGDNRILRAWATLVILVFYTTYVGAQFLGTQKLLHATFGLDPTWGILLGAAVVLAYTSLGGFLAVAWTDLFQGILMAGVAILLPVLAYIQLGGMGGLQEALAATRGGDYISGTEFFRLDAGETGRALVFGVMIGGLSWGLGYSGMPHLLTRFMAIKSVRDLRLGSLVAMSWVLLAYWGAAFIGIFGVAILGPDLADQEQVMPLLALALVPAWLAGMLISGALAAMMSSADSMLIVATSALIEDVYVQLIRRGRAVANAARLVAWSRLAALVVTVVAVFSAFAMENVINTVVSYAWAGLGSSFGPVILLAIWWKRLTRGGALAGMVTGLTSTVLWKSVPALQDFLDIKAASFLLALAAVVVFSLLRVGPRIQRR